MLLPRKVGDKHVANWNRSSKNSRKIITSLEISRSSIWVSVTKPPRWLCRNGHGRESDRERRLDWSLVARDPRSGGGADGRARPRHRRFTETTLDLVRGLFLCGPAHSCAAPARSDVRSAPE